MHVTLTGTIFALLIMLAFLSSFYTYAIQRLDAVAVATVPVPEATNQTGHSSVLLA
jgi:hypothetical protein